MFALFQAMLQSPKSLPHEGIREGWLGTFIPNGSNEPLSPRRIYSDFTGSKADTSSRTPESGGSLTWRIVGKCIELRYILAGKQWYGKKKKKNHLHHES